MAFNGSGTYSLPAGQPVVTGTTISSTTHNTLMADIQTALNLCLNRDGQSAATSDIPMGTNKLTGLKAGTNLTDAGTLAQIQNGLIELSTVAGTDTITATSTPTPAAYAAGQMFGFIAAGDNTGAATINISSLGAKSITKLGTTALAAGDIKSGMVHVVRYDGSRFQLINLGNVALTTNTLSQFAATTSAQLAGVLSDETGSGSAVFANSPTLVTPALGTAASGAMDNCTGATQTSGDNSTKLATTAYADAAGTRKHFSAYLSSAQTISVGTDTKLQLATEEYDVDATFDSVTNYRWTPGVTGHGLVTINLKWNSFDGGSFSKLFIYKNGSTHKHVDYVSGVTSAQGFSATFSLNVTNASDYFEFYVYQSTTLNRGLVAGNGETQVSGFMMA